MALTVFGKTLRKLRIDRDLMLKDLADRLGMTSTFVSAVESGRKSIPTGFVAKVAQAMNLQGEERASLEDAAAQSRTSVSIHFGSRTSPYDRSLAVQLARKFDDLDEKQKNEIAQILTRGDNR